MNNQISSLEFSHFPVMLNEILKIVKPYKGGKFIDCTFGGGGYSKEILNFPGAYIQAIDRDKKVFNGLEMFIYQGQKAFYLWNKINPEIDQKLIELLLSKLK